jgi:hypothetical protein
MGWWPFSSGSSKTNEMSDDDITSSIPQQRHSSLHTRYPTYRQQSSSSSSSVGVPQQPATQLSNLAPLPQNYPTQSSVSSPSSSQQHQANQNIRRLSTTANNDTDTDTDIDLSDDHLSSDTDRYEQQLTADDLSDDDKPPSTWLLQWNNSYNPEEISCRLSFDILMYCLTPANQLRTIYRTGRSDSCKRQMYDVHRCMQIKALHVKDPAKARQWLYDTIHDRETNGDDGEGRVNRNSVNNVWTYRTEPPLQFRQQRQPHTPSADVQNAIE